MNSFTLSSLRQTRQNILARMADLTLAQLNIIPVGFSNNLIWNFGHVLVTQQLLCYKRSGQEMLVEEEIVNKYRKGSRPAAPVSLDE